MTLHKNLNTSGAFSCKLILACVMCFYCDAMFAQFYPVQVTPQLIPPYSVYLSDYATPGNEKLRVIIVQRDLTQPAYQLRLVMSVELNGRVIMRTARSFNPAPLNLDPGVPTIISGADLAPYLNSRNIDFVGYSREQYEKTRALPEGSYRITITAYDYRRQDVQVSNEGSSFYFLSKNEPPLINFPACGTKIPARMPQQIIFSWLPRNTASPNSAAETEYEFSLFETRPEGRNPNDVVLSSEPVFRVRTDFPQLVYGPAEPMLIENMKYVWRVQSIDKNGRDAFRNNGYSEVCTFIYGGIAAGVDLGVVKNLQAVGEAERRGKISWEASNYDSYRVYYKKVGNDYEWFHTDVTTSQLKVNDLEPNTEYETRVQVKKSGVFGPYSEIVNFKTKPKQVIDCGKETPAQKADESKPLLAAHKGMIIVADGMPIRLLEVVSLDNGWFKGMGAVGTRLLKANFHVKFERLFIDENQVAGFGRIDFITKGVAELVTQQMANAATKDKLAQQQANREQWSDQLFQENIFKYDDIIISDIHFEGDVLIITDADGNTIQNNEVVALLTEAPEKAIIIEDKNGDQWVVQKDENGENKVTKVSGGGLVVGSDGKIIAEKILRNLHKKILAALNKFQKAIEEYQASIKDVQPGKGGGPSLSEEELEMLLANLPACLESSKDQLNFVSNNITKYRDTTSVEWKQFTVDIAHALEPTFPTEDDRDNAPEEKVEEVVCEALAESSIAYSWNGSLLDDHFRALFDHVYDNNHVGNLKFHEEIQRLLSEKPDQGTLNLDYKDYKIYDKWVNNWRVRVANPEKVFDNAIKVIQTTKNGEKIGSIYLKPNHIYIAKYDFNGRAYPIAIYRAGQEDEDIELKGVFTKVVVSEMANLKKEEHRKYIYVEETFLSYFILAFYKEGQTAPTLMIQVEKFPFSDMLHNSMEEWLKFLGILIEGNDEDNNEEVFLDNVNWVSQFDEGIFGAKACFNHLLSDSTTMNVCCATASKYVLEQLGLSSQPPKAKCIAERTTQEDSETVKASGDFDGALSILRESINGGEPLIIGVHYPKDKFPAYSNTCAPTYHFMVVVGKGYDKASKREFFRFYDVGRNLIEDGTNEQNKLYVDESAKTISGIYRNKVYTITEVRPNH